MFRPLCVVFLGLVACDGQIIGSPRGPLETVSPDAKWSSDTTRRVYTCDATIARGTGRSSMQRLTRQQLEHTLSSLLGPTMYADAAIHTRVEGLPPDETQLAGDLAQATPVGWPGVLYEVGKRAVELGLADASWRTANLGSCSTATPLTESCVESATRTFGARVYRRDLTDPEVTSLMDGYRAAGGGTSSLGFLLRRLLQAPALAFHVETGTSDGSGRVKLTDFEVASRLSYLITDDMPDEALFAAARSGQLRTVDDLKREATRLLNTEAGKTRVHDFFRFYTRINQVPDPNAGAASLHALDVTGFGDQARAEAYDFAETIFWNKKSFGELMTSTAVKPLSNGALSSVFDLVDGVSASHPGLLHRPALLLSTGARTSPIVRGAHLRKTFLCDALGTPDPALLQARMSEVGDLEAMSNRAKTEKLTGAAACLGCHSQINSLGFSFEGYDQLGAIRTEEVVLDMTGQPLNRFPIDTAVTAPNIEESGPPTLTSSRELAEVMASSSKATACFARRAFEYYQLRTVNAADACALADAENVAHQGSLLDTVIASVANEDLFYRQEQP